MNNNFNSQASQRQQIMGAISSLMSELKTLAPHPEKPNHNGPLFFNCDIPMQAANDHESMLGSMMMETLLGSAFIEAASEAFGSWTQDVAEAVDLTNALECYSEYISDIEYKDDQKSAAHGKGSFARIAGKSIANGFNLRSAISQPMQAFYDDLPKRMRIEKALMAQAKKLKNLDNMRPDVAFDNTPLAA